MSKCKYEAKNGRCGLKESYAYRKKCYTEECCRCHEPIEPCSRHEPMTNADRIRAMTDEELADFIDEPTLCKGHGLGDCMSKDCKKCILEWIKQPAE